MKQPDQNQGMPLVIWAGALVMALAILSGIWHLYSVRDQRVRALNPGLTEHSSSQHDTVKAYFLGSSLTKYALIQYHTLDSLLKWQNKTLKYRVVVSAGTGLASYNSRIDEIINLRPSYLFIESNLACINYQGNSGKEKVYQLSRFRTRLARIPFYIVKMKGNAFDLLETNVPEPFSDRNKTKLDFDFIDEENLKLRGEVLKVRNIDEFPEWSSFFKAADSLGIRVFLLELPRSGEAEKHLPAGFKEQHQILINQYGEKYGIPFLDFPEELGYVEYYHDRAHFNKAGSFYYSEWLLRELGNLEIVEEIQ